MLKIFERNIFGFIVNILCNFYVNLLQIGEVISIENSVIIYGPRCIVAVSLGRSGIWDSILLSSSVSALMGSYENVQYHIRLL